MEENKTGKKKIECSKDLLESWTERQRKPQKREMSGIKRLSQEPWYMTGKEEREAEKVREGRWVYITQWWHTPIYEDYSNETLFLHKFEVHDKTDQEMQSLVPASPPLPYTISSSPHPSPERCIASLREPTWTLYHPAPMVCIRVCSWHSAFYMGLNKCFLHSPCESITRSDFPAENILCSLPVWTASSQLMTQRLLKYESLACSRLTLKT